MLSAQFQPGQLKIRKIHTIYLKELNIGMPELNQSANQNAAI